MNKKIVSVFNHTPPKREEITDDHIYLLGSYISVLRVEYCLSNLRTTNLFVREFKKKTNSYIDYLQTTVYKKFEQTYNLDEEFMDNMFEETLKVNEFQVEQFLKLMCKK